MLSTSNEYQPVVVGNPSTGEPVNVEPILGLMDSVGEGSMLTVGAELDVAIKYIALSDGTGVNLNKQEIIRTLYEIRDAFINAGQ